MGHQSAIRPSCSLHETILHLSLRARRERCANRSSPCRESFFGPNELALVVAVLAFRPRQLEAVGFIGDSVCGLHPDRFTEAFHVDDRTCALNCVKFGGKFVLVSDGGVYPILNQDFRGLADFVGTRVAVSGSPGGDHGIVISRIASAAN
jgi:hypothetical protein